MATINTSDTALNAYHVYWINFVPESGIVTKHDQITLGAIYAWNNQKEFNHAFGSKEDALSFLKDFSKKLNKRYACRLYTDKQFSLRKEGEPIPFTTKQLNEVYYIG